MTSLSFDSKLKNWSGAQQAIIRAEPLCISMSPCTKNEKRVGGWWKERWRLAAKLIFLITPCLYQYTLELCKEKSSGLQWIWFPSLIRGNQSQTLHMSMIKTCGIVDYFLFQCFHDYKPAHLFCSLLFSCCFSSSPVLCFVLHSELSKSVQVQQSDTRIGDHLFPQGDNNNAVIQ